MFGIQAASFKRPRKQSDGRNDFFSFQPNQHNLCNVFFFQKDNITIPFWFLHCHQMSTNIKGTYLCIFLKEDNWFFHRCFWSKSQATFFFTLKAIRTTLIEIPDSNLVFIVTFFKACRVSQSCFTLPGSGYEWPNDESLCQQWFHIWKKIGEKDQNKRGEN